MKNCIDRPNQYQDYYRLDKKLFYLLKLFYYCTNPNSEITWSSFI